MEDEEKVEEEEEEEENTKKSKSLLPCYNGRPIFHRRETPIGI
jgi:hypothetical protein